MACCVPDDVQFYPPKQWGLDYHFNTYNKMYILDILDVQPYPRFPEAFCYKNHPIYKVDVLGTIVKKTENSKCFIYADNKRLVEMLPAPLLQKFREIQTDSETATEGYSLGDLVQFKGKLKIFREKKEVVASFHKKIEDPTFQLFRINEQPRLYRQCYDRPFQLPYKVHQALYSDIDVTGQTGNKSQAVIAAELKTLIHGHVSQCSHIVDLLVTDLLQVTKVKDYLTQQEYTEVEMEKQMSVLTQAVNLLENDGHVTRRTDRRNLYEVLLHKSKMEKRIILILTAETKKTKYSEKGCHYLHVLDELHKTLQYGKVKKEAVMFCLQKLETQSDVIRTTHAHYIPCNA